MAITIHNSVASPARASGSQHSLPSLALTVGRHVLVFLAWRQETWADVYGPGPAVTDDLGNVYTPVPYSTGLRSMRVRAYLCPVTVPGTAVISSVFESDEVPSAEKIEMVALELSGVHPLNPLESYAYAVGDWTGTPGDQPIPEIALDAGAFRAFAFTTQNLPTTIAWNDGYTALVALPSGAASLSSREHTGPSTPASTVTLGAREEAGAVHLALRAAGGDLFIQGTAAEPEWEAPSVTVVLENPPALGNLLIASFIATDDWRPPGGWIAYKGSSRLTESFGYSNSYYRVSNGQETGVTFNTVGSPQGERRCLASLVEYALPGAGLIDNVWARASGTAISSGLTVESSDVDDLIVSVGYDRLANLGPDSMWEGDPAFEQRLLSPHASYPSRPGYGYGIALQDKVSALAQQESSTFTAGSETFAVAETLIFRAGLAPPFPELDASFSARASLVGGAYDPGPLTLNGSVASGEGFDAPVNALVDNEGPIASAWATSDHGAPGILTVTGFRSAAIPLGVAITSIEYILHFYSDIRGDVYASLGGIDSPLSPSLKGEETSGSWFNIVPLEVARPGGGTWQPGDIDRLSITSVKDVSSGAAHRIRHFAIKVSYVDSDGPGEQELEGTLSASATAAVVAPARHAPAGASFSATSDLALEPLRAIAARGSFAAAPGLAATTERTVSVSAVLSGTPALKSAQTRAILATAALPASAGLSPAAQALRPLTAAPLTALTTLVAAPDAQRVLGMTLTAEAGASSAVMRQVPLHASLQASTSADTVSTALRPLLAELLSEAILTGALGEEGLTGALDALAFLEAALILHREIGSDITAAAALDAEIGLQKALESAYTAGAFLEGALIPQRAAAAVLTARAVLEAVLDAQGGLDAAFSARPSLEARAALQRDMAAHLIAQAPLSAEYLLQSEIDAILSAHAPLTAAVEEGVLALTAYFEATAAQQFDAPVVEQGLRSTFQAAASMVAILPAASSLTTRVKVTRILPLYPRGVFLQWDLSKLSEEGPHTFSVYRSGSPGGPWTLLESGIETLNYVDALETEDPTPPYMTSLPNQLEMPRNLFYRVSVLPPSGVSNQTSTVTPVEPKLTDRFKLLRRKFLRDQAILLRKLNGVDVAVLKKRRWGERCTLCYDKYTKEIVRANCINCYGTGYVGGFYPPIGTLARRGTLPDHKELTPQGLTEVRVTQVTMLDAPQVDSDDILVFLQDNRRFIVKDILHTELKTVKVHQKLVVSELPRSSIEYRVPVDLSRVPPLF